MRWIISVAVVVMLVLAPHARGAGVDDQYLDIYNQILQAESSLQSGQSAAAAQQFLDARTALQKMRDENPNWNPDLVAFRIRYLTDQLAALGKFAPVAARAAGAPPSDATIPGSAPLSVRDADLAELKQVIGTLQQQVRSLSAANGELQGKLREALSVQPASVDPRELAKARETIIQLQKERDLLTASLDEEKSARQKAEGARKAPSDAQNAKLKQLGKERDELRKDLAARASELADAKSRIDKEQRAERESSRKVQQAEKERDELQKKLDTLAQTKKQRPADSGGSQNEALRARNDQLQARLAVLEAKPVPYTAQELALLKQGEPASPGPIPVNATSETTPVIHSVKDLPAGAGALMAQAMRAAEEGDYDGAETKFNEVLRQDENNVYVLARLASAQLAAGKLGPCEKNVQRALSLDPNDSGSLYLLGILRYRQEKLDEALNALSRSAQINPTNAGTQNYLGCVLSDKGLRKPAEAALRKALELEPNYKEANYNLGWVYATEKPPFFALARWHYQKALDEGHPRNSELEKLLAADSSGTH